MGSLRDWFRSWKGRTEGEPKEDPETQEKSVFRPNRKFRRKYDQVFRENPLAANFLLLLVELANEKGQVFIPGPRPEKEIRKLMIARFEDPYAYQLEGGPEQ